MINKEKVRLFKFNVEFEEQYMKVFSIIKKMEEIFKDRSFDEFDSLEEKDEKLAIEFINKLIDELIILNRISLGKIDWEKFKEIWIAPDFWGAIMKKTKEESKEYIQMEYWRDLKEHLRKELFRKIFEYNYLEKEDKEYISIQVGIDKSHVDAYIEFLLESEKNIFLYSISKRRYIKQLSYKFGIDNNDIEYVWEMFEENQKLIETLVDRRINTLILHRYEMLNKKINSIQQETNDLLDTMTHICECIEK